MRNGKRLFVLRLLSIFFLSDFAMAESSCGPELMQDIKVNYQAGNGLRVHACWVEFSDGYHAEMKVYAESGVAIPIVFKDEDSAADFVIYT
jgi:hypothetical protein